MKIHAFCSYVYYQKFSVLLEVLSILHKFLKNSDINYTHFQQEIVTPVCALCFQNISILYCAVWTFNFSIPPIVTPLSTFFSVAIRHKLIKINVVFSTGNHVSGHGTDPIFRNNRACFINISMNVKLFSPCKVSSRAIKTGHVTFRASTNRVTTVIAYCIRNSSDFRSGN